MDAMSKKNNTAIEAAKNDFEEILKSGKGSSKDVELDNLAREMLDSSQKQKTSALQHYF